MCPNSEVHGIAVNMVANQNVVTIVTPRRKCALRPEMPAEAEA